MTTEPTDPLGMDTSELLLKLLLLAIAFKAFLYFFTYFEKEKCFFKGHHCGHHRPLAEVEMVAQNCVAAS